MNLGNRIKELRKKVGYSQEKLAEVMNVTTGAVCKWEGNLSYPDLSNLVMLAKIFSVSIDYLLDCNITFENERNVCSKVEQLTLKGEYILSINDVVEYEIKYPNSFQVLFCLANYLFSFGFEENRKEELNLALKYYYRALTFCEFDNQDKKEEIQENIIEIYRKLGEYLKAIDCINEFHINNPSFALGCCYESLGQYDLALDYLSKSMMESLLNLANAVAYEAEVLYKINRRDEALGLLDFGIQSIKKLIIDKNSVVSGIMVVLLTLRAIILFPDIDDSIAIIKDIAKEYKRNKTINAQSVRYCYADVIPVTTFSDDLLMQVRGLAKKLLNEDNFLEFEKLFFN